MLNLDPAKLLVIAVVAIILLGPDRLPQVARQVGAAWRSFNEFRHRMETEVRSTMPDLPPTPEIARLARSPSALLNKLSVDERRRRRPERRREANGEPSDDGAGRGGGRDRGRRDRAATAGRGRGPWPNGAAGSNGNSRSLPGRDAGRRTPRRTGPRPTADR